MALVPGQDPIQPATKPRLYVVATSHLDTQWRWTIQTTIRHFLRRTLLDNFERMRSSPGYVLSFEGAFRYQLVEEYYPEEFQELLRLVRERRWRPAGAMLDAPDTNLPSPESLIRHILYGNGYFEAKFGCRCVDLFLPDCFGFPWSLPTVAAHCGIKGFSSQKLGRWKSPAKIPFDIGLWEGPDGSRIIAILNPGDYSSPLREDLSRSPSWRQRLETRHREIGVNFGYKYFGVGDRGGAPDRTSLDYLDQSLDGSGDIEVIHAGSDQLFRDLSSEDRAKLPIHRGDLLLPTHGTGCWTVQGVLKKWNRRCELLAEAAERAALAADWLGGQDYPAAELRQEWTRFLWHQMHDDLTGTSSPEAYRFTSNDLILAQSRLSALLHWSVASVARGLDTRSEGVPIVVFNPLGFDREELVDAWVRFDSEPPAAVTVNDPTGREMPCQELEREDKRLRILFPARVPSVGFAVYQVLPTEPRPIDSDLDVTRETLENQRYRVRINGDGAIASLYDKQLERELLSEPMDVAFLPDHSARWPAWEIRYQDICSKPIAIGGPVDVRILEHGPVRVTLEIARTAGPTTMRQRLSLAVGEAGSRLEIAHDIEWRSSSKLLKAVFPIALDEAVATYDMGLGAIQRGPNTREQYEVPAHEWADLSGSDWGVSILSRHKYGWDRPDENTLRLSLLRSPKALRRFAHQATQDFGRHEIAYALEGHRRFSTAGTSARAASFNQPLFPFQAAGHPGALGRQFSLLRIEGDGVHLMALKRAEGSNRWMARIRETAGASTTRLKLTAPRPFLEVAHSDGCEQSPASAPVPAQLSDGSLTLDLPGFAPRSVLLTPGDPPHRISPLDQATVALGFDTTATTFHGQGGSNFDGKGHSIPGELFPSSLRAAGLSFTLGPNLPGAYNALACRGQELDLPAGDFDHLALLATSTDRAGTTMRFPGAATRSSGGSTGESVRVPYYSGFVGQWKLFSGRIGWLLRRWKPGFIERTPVAWIGSHRHDRRVRDQVYTYCYLFLIEIPVSPGTRTLRLPNAPEVKLFAATVSRASGWSLEPAALFYD